MKYPHMLHNRPMYGLTRSFNDEKLKAMLPPEAMREMPGDGDFLLIGERFTCLLVDELGVGPDSLVLDIGCSVGRMAIPLTEIITGNGSYEGYDPIPEGPAWCKENITPKFPHFNFQRLDVHNDGYNPNGSISECEVRFPYEDHMFDAALATSIFTHVAEMDAVLHHFKETARVLKNGGGALFTFFLADAQAHVSNDTIAYHSEVEVRRMAKVAGLEVTLVHHGCWSGAYGVDYQDTVFLKKI